MIFKSVQYTWMCLDYTLKQTWFSFKTVKCASVNLVASNPRYPGSFQLLLVIHMDHDIDPFYIKNCKTSMLHTLQYKHQALF